MHSYYAVMTVIAAETEQEAVALVARQMHPFATVLHVGNAWEVNPVSYCPRCDATGADQSCIEDGELIDDHAERGSGQPFFEDRQLIAESPYSD